MKLIQFLLVNFNHLWKENFPFVLEDNNINGEIKVGMFDKGVCNMSEHKAELAFHETMDTHEMVNFKTICLMKTKLMQGVCFDNDLKKLMDKDIEQSMQALKELQTLYRGARTDYQHES